MTTLLTGNFTIHPNDIYGNTEDITADVKIEVDSLGKYETMFKITTKSNVGDSEFEKVIPNVVINQIKSGKINPMQMMKMMGA